MMDNVMENVLIKTPFVKETHHATKPLYAALVPDEIFKGSHFERRFVTPFGGVWEKLAQVVAVEAHGNCSMGHSINGTIGTESLRRIQEVLNRLEHNAKGEEKVKPDWKTELDYIKKGGGDPIPVSVTCDIFIHNEQTNTKYAFELKAPFADNYQIRECKKKMFNLMVMSPAQVDYAYFALPFNPFDEKDENEFFTKWFDIEKDESVLIGDKFWELIGEKDAYHNIIQQAILLGKGYKERIYEEFFS